MPVKSLVRRMPLTKARINLGAVVRRVHLNKEYVILEKDGIPIAGLMDIDELEDYLDLQDAELKKQIAEGHQEYLGGELTEDMDAFLNRIKRKKRKASRK